MTTMQRALLILIAVLAGACSRVTLDPQGVVCVQDGTSDETRAALDEAVFGWAQASNDRIALTVRDGIEHDDCGVLLADGLVGDNTDDHTGNTAYSFTSIPAITIDVFDIHNAVTTVLVVGHELGHAMGADHTDHAHDTMATAGSFTQNWPPTAADVGQVL